MTRREVAHDHVGLPQHGVAVDEDGFIRTDVQLTAAPLAIKDKIIEMTRQHGRSVLVTSEPTSTLPPSAAVTNDTGTWQCRSWPSRWKIACWVTDKKT